MVSTGLSTRSRRKVVLYILLLVYTDSLVGGMKGDGQSVSVLLYCTTGRMMDMYAGFSTRTWLPAASLLPQIVWYPCNI